MAEYKTLVKKIPVSPDKKTKQKDYLKKGQLPIVDQGQSLIGGYTDDANMTVECELPVIVFGDHTRAVKYITFPFGAGADGIKVLQPKENILPRFLYYGTQYVVAKMPNRGYARHYQYVEKEDLPVPPILEQERIVARIEELFSQLDAGVETLKKTKAQLAVYRQSVLKEAFYSIDSSLFYPLRTVILGSPQNGLYKPKNDYSDSGTPILRIDGFYDGFISSDYRYKRVNITCYEIDRYGLNLGDLVVNRVNSMPYLGKCALVRSLVEPTVFESNMMRIKLDVEMVDGDWVAYYLSSRVGKKELTKNAKQAVNQASINQTDIGNALVPIPTIDKQKRLVEIIETRLSVCDSIEQTVDTALQQAEAMRQSILKDAFEGRL